jgi:hypothetical protein
MTFVVCVHALYVYIYLDSGAAIFLCSPVLFVNKSHA